MIRLHLVVEGQTEETFVREVLSPEMANHSVVATAHCITTGRIRDRAHRGGFMQYAHLRRDLDLWMKQDRNRDARFTTMIDYYRMPPEFPGFEESKHVLDPLKRVRFLEEKFGADIDDWRFLPYIQVHEFESLLFSDPSAFSIAFPNSASAIGELTRTAESASSPEHIDDGPSTSPAKRIAGLLPEFAKPVHGPMVASCIGLAKLRKSCIHFDEWFGNILKMSVDASPLGEPAAL